MQSVLGLPLFVLSRVEGEEVDLLLVQPPLMGLGLLSVAAAVEDPWERLFERVDGAMSGRERLRKTQVVMVGRSDLAYGLIRMYASLAGNESQRFTPCRDWSKACEILAIDPTLNLLADTAGA